MQLIKRAFLKRLGGEKPSPLAAALTAIVVGIAAAVLTYRFLRS